MAISIPCMCLLETRLAVCSPQVPGESRQQDLLKYLGESCGNCNWPVIVNICWIFDLHFSRDLITTCIRVLGSLPVSIQPERDIYIMGSSRSDANLQTSDGIPSLPTALLFCSLLTICLRSCTLITQDVQSRTASARLMCVIVRICIVPSTAQPRARLGFMHWSKWQTNNSQKFIKFIF